MAALAIEHDGPLLRLTLARAEKRNALDRELLAALTEQFAAAGEARAVVLRGAGPTFSAGADVAEMRAALDAAGRAASRRRAGVAGPARGRRRLPGARRRRRPGRLPRRRLRSARLLRRRRRRARCPLRLQRGQARHRPRRRLAVRRRPDRHRAPPGALFVTGERFEAERALRLGLVSEVVDDLDAGVERVLDEILGGGPEAVRIAKRIAREPLGRGRRRAADRRAAHERGGAGGPARLPRAPAAASGAAERPVG